MLEYVWNRTSCSFMGVPASACTNAVTPAFTCVIDAPMEFDSSITSASGPPQRLRASANDGAPWMLFASMTVRVVPPAVMLIWLMPPPAPGVSPPPLIVTTTRLAFLMYESVWAIWLSLMASAASGSLTRMTHVGAVTPGTNGRPPGGPGRSRRTIVDSHVHPPPVDSHRMRASW